MKRILFILLVLFLPSQLGFHFWPSWSLVNGVRVDYLSPTLYFTDVLSVVLISLEIRNLRLSDHFTKLFLFAGFILLNILFSVSPLVSLYAWLKFIQFFLLSIVVYRNRNSFAALFIKLLPITVTWVSILGIAQWIHSGSLNGIFYWLGERSFTTQTPGIALSKVFCVVSLRPYSTLPHPNVLAGFIVVSLLFLSTRYTKKSTLLIMSLIPFIVLLLTESYSALIALFICLVSVFTQKHTRISSRSFWRMTTTGFIVASFVSVFFASFFALASVSQNSRERMELLYVSGLSVSEHPIHGSGLGTFIVEIPKYTSKLPSSYRSRATSWLQPVHNVPLLVFSETGIGGLALLFVGINLLPAIAPILAILVISLFDHYWVTLQAPALLFAIVAALTYNSLKLSKKE